MKPSIHGLFNPAAIIFQDLLPMNSHELAHLLKDQPLQHLRRLAKNRVPRHFRMGKSRLIQALIDLPPDLHLQIRHELQHLPSSSTFGARSRLRRRERPHRPDTRPSKPDSSPSTPATQSSLTIDELLMGIGVPPARPFVPDPWQEEAVAQLAVSDVIVSVPTGSGKTYVATEAIRRAMANDQTVIYTSPLKALSNTKLTEFSQIFGADQVGILTGDRKDNPHAPVLIMTTEILRNLLYDATSGEIDVRLDTLGLVIMDESQYLADPERGVVWEETIIFCPGQARLLLLSASIGNPDEIAAWMTSIRPTPCRLIAHRNRSVPLRGAYLHPTGKLVPLFTSKEIVQGKGYTLHPEAKRLLSQYEEDTIGGRYRRPFRR